MGISGLVFTIGVDQLLRPPSGLETLFFLYVGPDQMLPLISALGAIVGVLLLVWHRVAVLSRKAWLFITRRGTQPAATRPAKTPAAAEDHIGRERAR